MNEAQLLIQHTYDAMNFLFFAFCLIAGGAFTYSFGAIAIGVYKAIKETNESMKREKQRTFKRKTQYSRI